MSKPETAEEAEVPLRDLGAMPVSRKFKLISECSRSPVNVGDELHSRKNSCRKSKNLTT